MTPRGSSLVNKPPRPRGSAAPGLAPGASRGLRQPVTASPEPGAAPKRVRSPGPRLAAQGAQRHREDRTRRGGPAGKGAGGRHFPGGGGGTGGGGGVRADGNFIF